jgi:hypothetical protein
MICAVAVFSLFLHVTEMNRFLALFGGRTRRDRSPEHKHEARVVTVAAASVPTRRRDVSPDPLGPVDKRALETLKKRYLKDDASALDVMEHVNILLQQPALRELLANTPRPASVVVARMTPQELARHIVREALKPLALPEVKNEPDPKMPTAPPAVDAKRHIKCLVYIWPAAADAKRTCTSVEATFSISDASVKKLGEVQTRQLLEHHINGKTISGSHEVCGLFVDPFCSYERWLSLNSFFLEPTAVLAETGGNTAIARFV